MKKIFLITVIILCMVSGNADTIFTVNPVLRQWNSTFTYTKFADYFDGNPRHRAIAIARQRGFFNSENN